jgi:hypothetical protein
VKNDILQRVKRGEEHPAYSYNKTEEDWIGHILRRNCRLRGAIEGKIEEKIQGTGRL